MVPLYSIVRYPLYWVEDEITRRWLYSRWQTFVWRKMSSLIDWILQRMWVWSKFCRKFQELAYVRVSAGPWLKNKQEVSRIAPGYKEREQRGVYTGRWFRFRTSRITPRKKHGAIVCWYAFYFNNLIKYSYIVIQWFSLEYIGQLKFLWNRIHNTP